MRAFLGRTDLGPAVQIVIVVHRLIVRTAIDQSNQSIDRIRSERHGRSVHGGMAEILRHRLAHD